jgi:hypothetical protein
MAVIVVVRRAVLITQAWRAALCPCPLRGGFCQAVVDVAGFSLRVWWVATFWLGCQAAYACGCGVSCFAAVVARA